MEDARTLGSDINIRYSKGEWSGGAGYSYLDTKAHVYNTDHSKLERVIIDGMAYHKGNIFVSWTHRFSQDYNLGVGLYGRFSTKRYYAIDGDGKGFQIWKLTTTHLLGHSRKFSYRLEAGIDNIFNYVDRTPHGLHLGTTTPGTTVYMAFNIRFQKGKRIKNINLKTNHNNEED